MPNLKFLSLTVPEIWRFSQNFKKYVTRSLVDTIWPNFALFRLGRQVANLHAEFDMERFPKFQKLVTWPFRPFWPNFAFFFREDHQWPICMPNLKFLALTVPRYGGGPKISKSRSRDPFKTPFDLILYFFALGLPV